MAIAMDYGYEFRRFTHISPPSSIMALASLRATEHEGILIFQIHGNTYHIKYILPPSLSPSKFAQTWPWVYDNYAQEVLSGSRRAAAKVETNHIV